MASGRVTLIRAANVYVGGLAQARQLAGVPKPRRRVVAKNTWTKEAVAVAIKARHRAGSSLASTLVPQTLYTAARRHFGNWSAALAAANIDVKSTRISLRRYTKQMILNRLRDAARNGSDLRSASLIHVLDLKALRREFGTLEKAVRAAGLIDRLQQRRHGSARWTRDRLIRELREQAERRVYQLTPSQRRAAQLLFGGTHEARRVAGVPDPIDVRRAQRHAERARSPARTTTTRWSRERLVRELREQAAKRVYALTPKQHRAARLLFGGAREARRAAGVPDPIDLRRAQRRAENAAFAERHRVSRRPRRSS